ncbi:MAG: hypothetical protein A3F41_00715, partial [Coxiella sp. RIFCSPHIGHO2_12_FULL_44_14]
MNKKLLEQAQQAHQEGDLQSALKKYQQLLEEDPQQPEAWHCAGILLVQLGRYDEALTYVDQAIQQQPKMAAFHNSRGNVLLRLRRFVEATKAYYTAIQLDPHYAVAYNNLGNSFEHQHKIKNAIQAYKKAIVLYPHFPNAHFNYGRALLKQGDIESALKTLKKAIALDPNHTSALSQIAQIYLNQADYQNAIHYYQKRLRIQPHHADTHHHLGIAWLKEKQWEKALHHLEQALALNDNEPLIHYHLATAYLQLKQRALALRHYLRQIEKQPHAESYYNIGILLMYQEHHSEAIDYFQKAIAMDPYSSAAIVNIATLYLKLEKIPEAIAYYHQALKINPNDPEIQFILSALSQKKAPSQAPAEYLQHLFDQYADYYDPHLTQYLSYQAPQQLYQAIQLESTDSHPQWKILDLGCGTGLCGFLFKSMSRQLIGIDISEKMIEVARQKNVYDILEVGNIEQALDQHKNNHLIVAADVFTYIGDLDSIFKKVVDALTPNGLFAFTIEKTAQKPYVLQQTIRYAHSQEYIQKLIEAHSFIVERFDNLILRKQKNQPLEG